MGSGAPSAPKVTNRIIEYPRLRTKTAPIGTIGRSRAKERARSDAPPTQTQERERGRAEWSLCQDIKREPSDEGPDQSGLETDRDRDDDAEDEHGMWLGIPDAEVWDDGEFDQGRHHRADRSE